MAHTWCGILNKAGIDTQFGTSSRHVAFGLWQPHPQFNLSSLSTSNVVLGRLPRSHDGSIRIKYGFEFRGVRLR